MTLSLTSPATKQKLADLPNTHDGWAQRAKEAFVLGKHDEATFCARMATYEAMILPSYGMSVGEHEEWKREHQC